MVRKVLIFREKWVLILPKTGSIESKISLIVNLLRATTSLPHLESLGITSPARERGGKVLGINEMILLTVGKMRPLKRLLC